MMYWGVVLGKIVREVGFPRPPIYFELPLRFAISQPVKSHVHCFRSFGLDFAINYPVGGRVVRLNRCSWLRMPHLGEYLS